MRSIIYRIAKIGEKSIGKAHHMWANLRYFLSLLPLFLSSVLDTAGMIDTNFHIQSNHANDVIQASWITTNKVEISKQAQSVCAQCSQYAIWVHRNGEKTASETLFNFSTKSKTLSIYIDKGTVLTISFSFKIKNLRLWGGICLFMFYLSTNTILHITEYFIT